MFKFFILALLPVSSVAFAHPSTYEMTCARAKFLVQTNKSIVMNYAPNRSKRYVSSLYYCNSGRVLPAVVKTLDKRSCNIGYTCLNNDH